MNPKKYRWSRVYESAEEELLDFLSRKHITASRHEVDSYDTQNLMLQASVTHIWGVEGTAIFTIGAQSISMQPGDALDVPAQTDVNVTTRLSNFAWYQSQG